MSRVGARRLAGLLVFVAAGLALQTAPAHAQDVIASDRPGIGSASVVVAPGVLQAEFGLSYAGSDGGDALSLGQLFVRYGLGALELELLGNSWVDPRGDADGGFQDLGIGAKVRLAQGVGGRADLSLQGLLSLPTGTAGFTTDEVVPTLVGLADITLSDRAALSVNLAAQAGPGSVEEQLTATLTPGLSLTDRLSAYAGWAGTFTDGGDTHWVEGGLAFLASDDVQLDVNGARASDQWFLGVGMAVRTGAR